MDSAVNGTTAHTSEGAGESEQAEGWMHRLSSATAVGCASVLVCVIVLSAAIVVRYQPLFMVNDDLMMMAIASGDYTGIPTSNLVFIGAIPGVLMATAYEVAPRVPWYGLYLTGSTTFSIAVIATVLWLRRRAIGAPALMASTTALAAFLPVFLLMPTFTVSAMLTGLAAMVTNASRVGAGPFSNRVLIVLFALSTFLCASTRWSAFAAIVALFVPLLVLTLVRQGRRDRTWTVGILVGVALVVLTTNAIASNQGNWAEYSDFNTTRGEIHGTPRLGRLVEDPTDRKVQAMLGQNEWTLDDVYMLRSWLFDDPDVYTEEKLVRVVEASGDDGFPSLAAGLRGLARARGWLLAIVGLCGIAGIVGVRTRAWLFSLFQLGWSCSVLTVIAATQRMPDRVALPSMLSVAVLLATCPALLFGDRDALRSQAHRRFEWLSAGLTYLVLAAVVVGPFSKSWGPATLSDLNQGRSAALGWQLDTLADLDPGGTFIVVGDAVEIEAISPFSRSTAFATTQMIGLGWPIFSPVYEERKLDLGLGSDLSTAILEHPRTYVVARAGVADLAQRAFAQRTGRPIVVRVVGILPNSSEVLDYSIG